MRRLLRRVLGVTAVTALVTLAPGPPSASALPAFGTESVSAVGASSSVTKVRVGGNTGYDRLVIDFGTAVTDYLVEYVDAISADGSGNPVPVQGTAFILISLTGVPAGAQAAGAAAPKLPGIVQVVDAGNFEGTLTFGVGTATKTGFRVFTLADPPRLVVDVAHAAATSSSSAPPTSAAGAAPTADPSSVVVVPSSSAPAISVGPPAAAESQSATSTLLLWALVVVAVGALVAAVVLFAQRRRI